MLDVVYAMLLRVTRGCVAENIWLYNSVDTVNRLEYGCGHCVNGEEFMLLEATTAHRMHVTASKSMSPGHLDLQTICRVDLFLRIIDWHWYGVLQTFHHWYCLALGVLKNVTRPILLYECIWGHCVSSKMLKYCEWQQSVGSVISLTFVELCSAWSVALNRKQSE